MMSILIKIIICMFIFIAFCTIEKKGDRVNFFFKAIHNSYCGVLNSNGPVIKFLMIFAFILGVIEILLMTIQKYCLAEDRGITWQNILLAVIVWKFIILILYFMLGSALTIFSRVVDVIGEIKDNKISTKMMISFVLLSLLSFFSLMFEKEIKENSFFLLGGLGTCYFLNLRILFKIVQNPFCLMGNMEQNNNKNRVLIISGSILILVMLVINMYLFVLWTYYSYENAYSASVGTITKWTLLYYTIVSFTTIGYGDIVPAIFESQAVAMLIAATSVICLVIFVSSILSEKKDILTSNQDNRKESRIAVSGNKEKDCLQRNNKDFKL